MIPCYRGGQHHPSRGCTVLQHWEWVCWCTSSQLYCIGCNFQEDTCCVHLTIGKRPCCLSRTWLSCPGCRRPPSLLWGYPCDPAPSWTSGGYGASDSDGACLKKHKFINRWGQVSFYLKRNITRDRKICLLGTYQG